MPVGWAQMGLGHIGVACTAGQRDCCGDAVSYNCSLFCSLVESTSSVCTRYCSVAADCGTNGYVCMPSADSAGLCAVATQWWMVGMALCFAGTVISNFGTQFQKIALRRNKQLIRETFRTHGPGLVLASVQEKQSWQLPLWFGGAFMMGIGSVLDILSLAFAAQSLLACLAASTFVITIISSPFVVGEQPTRSDWFAVAFITVGCILGVAFAQQNTRTYQLDQLLGFFIAPLWFFYMLFMVAWMVTASIFLYNAEKPATGEGLPEVEWQAVKYGVDTAKIAQLKKSAEDPKSIIIELLAEQWVKKGLSKEKVAEEKAKLQGDYLSRISRLRERADKLTQIQRSALANQHTSTQAVLQREAAKAGVAKQIVDLEDHDKIVEAIGARCDEAQRDVKPYALLYAAIAGQCGGNSMLFAKAITEVFKTSILTGDVAYLFEFPTIIQAAVLIGGLALSLLAQIRNLNEAARNFEFLLYFPIYQSLWILSTLLNGLLFYKEYEGFLWYQLVFFPLGISIATVGIIILLRGTDSALKSLAPEMEGDGELSETGASRGYSGSSLP